MAIQVILQENLPSLGYIGDIVSVKPGYARNFLIPRGIAVDASSTNGKLLQHKVAGIQAKRAKLKTEAEQFGKQLADLALEFTLKAGEAGRSFGAITAKDIEAAFKAKGFEINKKQIRLAEPIKTAGAYRIEVKVHAEVTTVVPVKVISDAPPVKKEASEEAAAPKKPSKKKGAKASSDESAETVEA